jgi:serine/threonine protein kinase
MVKYSLLSPGKLLDDRYEIVRKLSGDGYSCTSYLAIDRNQAGYQPPDMGCPPSSDLYALALTALTLLTGRDVDALHKFCDLHTCKLQVKVLCGHVSLSPELGNILDRLLQYHPHDRYQSATAVMEALNREVSSR